MSAVEGDRAEQSRPPLLAVKGDATAEEVAALVAVFSGLAASAVAPVPQARSQWASPQRAVRGSSAAGPGGWRSSALPR